MVYYADEMALEPVREVFWGEGNDVSICRDLNSPLGSYYTLLIVKDRVCAKQLLAVFEDSERVFPDDVSPYIKCFAQNEHLCYVFEYRPERKLSMFAPGQITSVHIWETVCTNLVMECLASPLPYPLLALALEQGDVHLEKDNAVFIAPYFNLKNLSAKNGEAACARRCAELMLSLMAPAGRRVKSAELMKKKLAKNAFRGLPELYRDMRVTAIPTEKRKLRERIKGFWFRNKDILFRILLAVCMVIAAAALIILASQLLFGEVPFFRLFEDCFDVIGTRVLK